MLRRLLLCVQKKKSQAALDTNQQFQHRLFQQNYEICVTYLHGHGVEWFATHYIVGEITTGEENSRAS